MNMNKRFIQLKNSWLTILLLCIYIMAAGINSGICGNRILCERKAAGPWVIDLKSFRNGLFLPDGARYGPAGEKRCGNYR